jgi:pyruvate/2-oxoglutarate dehydrogenase complex dihydrolipoamide dehydrogenase (E3) component
MTEPAGAWTSDDVDAADGRPWDLLVVGGGTAGIVAARTAAGLGASVLLVERDRTGGDCLWTGCVPSKALLAAAHHAADARSLPRYGIGVDGVTVDFPSVLATVRAAVAAVEPADSPSRLREQGVKVTRGALRFRRPGVADMSGNGVVDGTEVRFTQALLACGAEPVVPDLPGIRDVGAVTSETVWSLRDLPAQLLVLGGGSVGCELGQAFARLGSAVTLVEAGPRLLLGEDPDAADVVAAALVADGVTLATSTELHELARDGGRVRADLTDGSRIWADALLLAVGRRPRSGGLGLDEIGVAVDGQGAVRVDRRLRTTNRRVWAAGDICGPPYLTHVAGVHAGIAASNAVLGVRRRVADHHAPRVTFTQPEVAAVGMSTAQQEDDEVTIRTVLHTDVDRAVAEQRTEGFSRLALDPRGRVLGATIVGPRAGESLPEVALAVRSRMRARDLAATTHAYPTYSDGLWSASIEQVQRRLNRGLTRRTVAALATVRRWRLH